MISLKKSSCFLFFIFLQQSFVAITHFEGIRTTHSFEKSKSGCRRQLPVRSPARHILITLTTQEAHDHALRLPVNTCTIDLAIPR